MGCVHIYCGDGKGKTTAAAGLALRMAGSGGRAVIARFLKNDDSGEVSALRQIPGVEVLPCDKTFGFTWQMTPVQKKEASAYYAILLNKAFARAKEAAEEMRAAAEAIEAAEAAEAAEAVTVLLVLDEICAAISSGLVEEEQVLAYLDTRPERLEIVLTGREPSEALAGRADYISEIKKQKHPFDDGLPARKGIEY